MFTFGACHEFEYVSWIAVFSFFRGTEKPRMPTLIVEYLWERVECAEFMNDEYDLRANVELFAVKMHFHYSPASDLSQAARSSVRETIDKTQKMEITNCARARSVPRSQSFSAPPTRRSHPYTIWCLIISRGRFELQCHRRLIQFFRAKYPFFKRFCIFLQKLIESLGSCNHDSSDRLSAVGNKITKIDDDRPWRAFVLIPNTLSTHTHTPSADGFNWQLKSLSHTLNAVAV